MAQPLVLAPLPLHAHALALRQCKSARRDGEVKTPVCKVSALIVVPTTNDALAYVVKPIFLVRERHALYFIRRAESPARVFTNVVYNLL